MTLENENSVKKLVGMLIQVLHGEHSDTRDLAVVQLAVLGEKAVPHISAYLKDEADKENDMIKHFELFKDWEQKKRETDQAKAKFDSVYVRGWNADAAKEKMQYQEWLERYKLEEQNAAKTWNEFASAIIEKWNIKDPYFFDTSEDASPEYIGSRIETACGGLPRRQAVEGVLRALGIIGDKKVIPLLRKLPVYQFPYDPHSQDPQTPVFEKAKETINIIQKTK